MQSAWHWLSLMSQFAKHSEVVCPLATSASPSQIPIATRRIANERDVDERINADESESAVAGPSLLITEEERTTNEGERKGENNAKGCGLGRNGTLFCMLIQKKRDAHSARDRGARVLLGVSLSQNGTKPPAKID